MCIEAALNAPHPTQSLALRRWDTWQEPWPKPSLTPGPALGFASHPLRLDLFQSLFHLGLCFLLLCLHFLFFPFLPRLSILSLRTILSLVSSSLTAFLPLPLISWTMHRSFCLPLLCSGSLTGEKLETQNL